MARVVVIGGGASGLMAAIIASQKNEVTILETNDKCGKKILATGNGRCNYWNKEIKQEKYYSSNQKHLETILTYQDQVFDKLSSFGIYPRIKDNYYYPYSNQASSIREILVNQLKRNKVKVQCNFKVTDINKKGEVFHIKGENNTEILADKVIMATGSNASNKEQTPGYKILTQLGHSCNPIMPSLVPLIASERDHYDWNGVRCDATITLVIDEKTIKTEEGELQLTAKGISGICAFNLSGDISLAKSKQQKVEIMINFLPFLQTDPFLFLEERFQKLGTCTVENGLESLLNYKLLFILLKKSGIPSNTTYKSLTDKQKKDLINNLTHFKIEIIGTEDISRAQVCRGGIDLSEINPDTMESTITPSLYITGEVLDVDGICGGFNLAFAFITGYLAGKDVLND